MAKKLTKILALGVILIMGLGIFTGCGGKQEEKIRNDYLLCLHAQGETEAILDDVKILKNYGNYNGAVVVRMEKGAFAVITTIQVGGVDFIFSDSNIAIVWHDGQFFKLEEAYNNGLLTKNNLNAIAKKSMGHGGRRQ